MIAHIGQTCSSWTNFDINKSKGKIKGECHYSTSHNINSTIETYNLLKFGNLGTSCRIPLIYIIWKVKHKLKTLILTLSIEVHWWDCQGIRFPKGKKTLVFQNSDYLDN